MYYYYHYYVIPEDKKMRVTTKGQVTIPINIRERLGITPDTEVDFLQEGDRVFLLKRKGTARATCKFKKLRGIATVTMTTDEIMALTRDDK
jgi:AbrB family looped-hinge helix DNA binding protein